MTPLAPLVVLEGIDGAGKGTQAAAVTASLRQAGKKVELLSFPRYANTFFGQRIGEFLNGRFGQLADIHPFLVSLLYAGDRFESAETLASVRRQADIVVLDRFVHSNLAHQVAKAPAAEQLQLREWIEHVEHNVFKLPRPDLVILLDLPVDAAQELISRKAARTYTEKKADLQEADASYLQRVAACYRQLAEAPNWSVVPVTRQSDYRPIEDITADILRSIQTRFFPGESC